MSLAPPTPEQVKAFRMALGGISQVALAEQLGISRRVVEDWEAGKSKPPAYLRLALQAIDLGAAPWGEYLLKLYKRRNAIGTKKLIDQAVFEAPGDAVAKVIAGFRAPAAADGVDEAILFRAGDETAALWAWERS